MSGAINAARGAAARALHIRIYPAPRDLGESREILKRLKRYGEITTYKSLKYMDNSRKESPNSALAIYRTVDSASKLLSHSPLNFSLEPRTPLAGLPERANHPLRRMLDRLEASDPDVKAKREAEAADFAKRKVFAEDDESGWSTTTTASRKDKDGAAEPDGEDVDDEHASSLNRRKAPKWRNFILYASPWRGNLHHHLERSPYAGPFGIDGRSPAQRDLAQVVPLPGLSMIDLKQPPRPMEFVMMRREALRRRVKLRDMMPKPGEEDEQGVDGLLPFLDQNVQGVGLRRARGGGGDLKRRDGDGALSQAPGMERRAESASGRAPDASPLLDVAARARPGISEQTRRSKQNRSVRSDEEEGGRGSGVWGA